MSTSPGVITSTSGWNSHPFWSSTAFLAAFAPFASVTDTTALASPPPAPAATSAIFFSCPHTSLSLFTLIVFGAGGGLGNALVTVSDAKGAKPMQPAVLDQKGCEFHPNVLVMAPGELKILNSDGVLHNIHTFSTTNPPFNKAQPKFKKEMVEKLEKPELIKVQCDAHSWMLGWIYVTENPTAVTDGNGAFKLENVPPGKHKVEVVHPVLGKQTKEVEVKAGQDTRVAFELKK